MIIDFHTHVFPDDISKKTISKLSKPAHIKAYTEGTLGDLKNSMLKNGVDISVVLPVVTKPSQFKKINKYAASITGHDGIISFGGIHPESEEIEKEIKYIKSLGLLGIKLHPDYQNTYIDDPRYIKIIKYALKSKLIVSIHSGLDVGLPDPVHCSPKHALSMLNEVYKDKEIDSKKAKIILAHTGGYNQWDQVEKYLVGKDVYFDTSFSLGFISDNQFVNIVSKHSPEKILFGTDSPWSDQLDSIKQLNCLPFTKEVKEAILYKNAERLLFSND